MPIPPEHQQLIIDAISERVGSRHLICPLCQNSQWLVQNRMVMLPLSDSSQAHPSESTTALPLAVVTCQSCGYTVFVNLIILGLGDALNIPEIKDA